MFSACLSNFFFFFASRAQGCKLIPTADQDLTDFTKCLAIMLEEIKSRQLQVNGARIFLVTLSSLWVFCRTILGPNTLVRKPLLFFSHSFLSCVLSLFSCLSKC